jgi:polyhydroxyalkanoate synthesis regulator phasin
VLGYLASTNAAYGAAIGTTSVGAGSQAALLAAQTGEFGAAGLSSTASSGAAASGSASGASFGAYAGYAALIYAAGRYASSLYDKGYTGSDQLNDQTYYKLSPENFNDRLFKAIGLSDKWSEILSGSVRLNALFGRAAPRVDATGVAGTLTAGDFSGQAFADITEKGGIFRSDKRYTQYAALPDELGRFLDDAAQSVYDQAKAFGEALGLPAEQLAGITSDIKVTLTDDAQANQAELAKVLATYGDALVKGYADTVAPLAAYGETTAQTIARVGVAISGVNDVLDALGFAALQASVDGGRAAVDLQQRFGGLAGLQQAAGAYFETYYTEAERADLATRQITETLAAVGLVAPTTRQGLRDLVDQLVQSGRLATEQGAAQFAALLSVQGVLASITEAARSAADIAREREGLEVELLRARGDTAALRQRELDALDPANRALQLQVYALQDQTAAADAAADATARMADSWANLTGGLRGGISDAYSAVAGAIESEQQRVQSTADTQLRGLEQQADRVRGVFGGLVDSLGRALDTVTGATEGVAGQARAVSTLRQALAVLRSGGSVDTAAVGAAAGTAARLDPTQYATRAQLELDRAQTAVLLRQVQQAAGAAQARALGDIAGQQVAVEAARDAQLDVLGRQLDEARSAASALVSIDDGVQTVAKTLQALRDAIGAQSLAAGGPGEVGRWLRSGGTDVWGAAGGAVAVRPADGGAADAVIRGLSGASFTVADAVGFARDRIAAGDYAGLRARAVAEGIDSDALDALLGLPPGTSLAEALRRGLPAFEYGSAYVPSTGLATVHEGERVFTRAENAAVLQLLQRGRSGTDTALQQQLLEAVRRLDDHLLPHLAQVAANTRKSSDQLRSWNATGMPDVRPA